MSNRKTSIIQRRQIKSLRRFVKSTEQPQSQTEKILGQIHQHRLDYGNSPLW